MVARRFGIAVVVGMIALLFPTAGAGAGTPTGPSQFTISGVSNPEGDTGTTPFDFTISRTGDTNQAQTVAFHTSDGTATEPSDYTAIPSGTVDFAIGDNQKTVTVNVNGDRLKESDETFNVTLDSTTGNGSVDNTPAVGTILNDEATATIDDTFLSEAGSPADFPVNLDVAPSSDVTLHWATADGTAKAGSDYTANSGTLTIPAGEQQGLIHVAVTNDNDPEDNETFTVTLSAPSTGTTIGRATGTALIIDDDQEGYWLGARDGGVFSEGSAKFFGSEGGKKLNAPIVGIAQSGGGRGYYLVASDGGVFTHGDAVFFGSEGNRKLNAPIVAILVTPSGGGYWLIASDGGVFTHGDAKFFGSEGGKHLNAPIVGAALSQGGEGYYLVASDGGIFTHGDAKFFGSEGGKKLNKPIVGMASSRFGDPGYWLVASDGGVFTHGQVGFFGSEGARALNSPVVGIATSESELGYYLVAADGGIFTHGDAKFRGSEGSKKLNQPIVGMAFAFAPQSG